MNRLNDWRREAEEYRDIDREAQRQAEAEIERKAKAKAAYQAAVTGTDPRASKRLNAALRRAWKLDKTD